jgi:hypothetical protein
MLYLLNYRLRLIPSFIAFISNGNNAIKKRSKLAFKVFNNILKQGIIKNFKLFNRFL